MTDMGDRGFYLCQDVSNANYIRKENKSQEKAIKSLAGEEVSAGLGQCSVLKARRARYLLPLYRGP